MQTYNFKDFLLRQTTLQEVELFKLFSDKILPIPEKDKFWIAGGAIRRTITNQPLETDVDYFFKRDALDYDFKGHLLDMLGKSVEILRQTDINTTYKVNYLNNENQRKEIKIQEIFVNGYDSPEELLKSFDFTICQFAYDGENLYAGDYSFHDLGRKRIVINNITYPVSSMRRLIKYTQQGYYACQGTMTSFLNIVSANPDLLKNTAMISSID